MTRESLGIGAFFIWTSAPTIVFVGVSLTVLLAPPIFEDDGGLTTGLLMFASFALMAFIWGGVDGWRRWPLDRVALRWVVAASVTAVSITVYNHWDYLREISPGSRSTSRRVSCSSR